MKKKYFGFTMIELIVVVAVMGIIMITITAILVNSFRAKNKVDALTMFEQSGDIVINSLRNNVFNANGIGISCETNPLNPGSTLTVTNASNGEITNLVCYDDSPNNKIASESAKGGVRSNIRLTSPDLDPVSCFDFARCDTLPGTDGQVSKVNFRFGLYNINGGVTGPSETATYELFQTSVKVRN